MRRRRKFWGAEGTAGAEACRWHGRSKLLKAVLVGRRPGPLRKLEGGRDRLLQGLLRPRLGVRTSFSWRWGATGGLFSSEQRGRVSREGGIVGRWDWRWETMLARTRKSSGEAERSGELRGGCAERRIETLHGRGGREGSARLRGLRPATTERRHAGHGVGEGREVTS